MSFVICKKKKNLLKIRKKNMSVFFLLFIQCFWDQETPEKENKVHYRRAAVPVAACIHRKENLIRAQNTYQGITVNPSD